VIEKAMPHPWVHGLALFYCETAMTKPVDIAEAAIKAIQKTGVKNKPVIACLVGGEQCVKAGEVLAKAGIPMYDDPAKAMSAFSALRTFAKFKAEGCKPDFQPFAGVDQKKCREIITAARANGRDVLTEPEAKDLFKAYGLPVTGGRLAKSPAEAAKIARETGFPVVAKIVSPQIIHKSDAGGVKVNLKDEAAVQDAYNTIIANAKRYKADADIHGVLIAEMAPLGREVIVGSVNDATFGPTVMFGLGGIFVEVLKDVTFRVAPFSPGCAQTMFPEIKAYPLLQGVRGEKRLDQEQLANTVSRLSQLVTDLADEIAETDANPLMLY
jgi:acetyltransferase